MADKPTNRSPFVIPSVEEVSKNANRSGMANSGSFQPQQEGATGDSEEKDLSVCKITFAIASGNSFVYKAVFFVKMLCCNIRAGSIGIKSSDSPGKQIRL